MHDVKSHDVHLTAKQLAPLEPGEQLAPFHEELSRFKLLFISTSRHPQTVGTSRHPQTIRTARHPQTIGTSRHRYKSQSHFAIALELACRHYHFSMGDRAASNKGFTDPRNRVWVLQLAADRADKLLEFRLHGQRCGRLHLVGSRLQESSTGISSI